MGHVGVNASERLGGDVVEECFTVGMVAREGSFQDGEGTWMEVDTGEDLAKVGWPD